MGKKYIVIGNPPFGNKGKLAKQFIDYSLQFADYVCFILPYFFYNKNWYNTIHNEIIDDDLCYFYYPNKEKVKANVVFQIITGKNLYKDYKNIPSKIFYGIKINKKLNLDIKKYCNRSVNGAYCINKNIIGEILYGK